MRLVQPIRSGLGEVLEHLSEGWDSLKHKAGRAITRFRPSGRDNADRPPGADWGIIAAELKEQADALTVRLELPGLDRDSIAVEVRGNRLYVAGEKRYERNDEDARFHVVECAYGQFQRVLELPSLVDPELASARYRDGVLSIRLPKRVGSPRHAVPVLRG